MVSTANETVIWDLQKELTLIESPTPPTKLCNPLMEALRGFGAKLGSNRASFAARS
jgi:hypothetical protein